MPEQFELQEQFEVNLSIKGDSFTEESAVLSSALEVMSGYEDSFSKCLSLSVKKFGTEGEHIPPPQIGLVSTRTGSLDVTTIIDCAAIALPLVPEVPNMISYAIELYKTSSDLVSIATNFFNRMGRPINVHIENSPGALTVVNIGNGNVNISDPNILEASKLIHKGINKMASQIEAGAVDTIEITHPLQSDSQQQIALLLDQSNKTSFIIPSKKKVDDQVIQIRCGIYSFNKKTGNGSLDVLEQGAEKPLKFEVHDVDRELVAGAMSAIYSIVSATREMTENALGELQVGKLHIHSITNHYDSPPSMASN
jgi:hypothetical protein